MAEGIAAPAYGAPPSGRKNYINATKGLWSWLSTVDHKRIGLMYLGGVLASFTAGGVFALLLRLKLMVPGPVSWMSADGYNKAFTLHGAIMTFLFIIPSIPAALGNFILPMMLGAKDVAFPKMNLFSLYLYWIGALVCLGSIVHGAVDTGWTFYTPYSTTTNTSVISMTLGVFILGFSSILTGLNFIVTTHKMRAPGLTYFRLPLLVWSLYATSIIQILATPVLGITLILLMLEKAFGIGIFDPTLGGDPVLFQHFFWFYSHPAVYIMILPGMGIISELIAVHARREIFGYTFVAFSSIAIALLSFLVWGHHMFVSGQSELAGTIFSFLTFFVAIPSGIKMFNWVATLYKGSIAFTAPMLWTLAFLFLFAIGGVTGIFLGMLSVNIHLHDTYFVVAHFHYVMMGGTVIAFFGGLHHWWPKMTGRMYSEAWARVAVALVFVGFNVTFFSQFIMGSRGMPRRYYKYLDQFQPLHQMSTVGSWLIGLGFLVMVGYLVQSLRKGALASANPWGAATAEWLSPSPPPTENFESAPVITHGPYDYAAVQEKEALS